MLALARSWPAEHPGRRCLVVSNRPDAGGLARAAALGLADRRASITARIAAPRRLSRPSSDGAAACGGAEVVCPAGFMRILTPGLHRAPGRGGC